MLVCGVCWLLFGVVNWLLCVVRGALFAVRCVLCAGCSLASFAAVACCLLVVVCCCSSFVAVGCSLCVVCCVVCLWFVVGCSLFVVRCLLSVVCCVLSLVVPWLLCIGGVC